MENSPGLCLVVTTWPADREVEAIARTLVDEQLAACVAVGGATVTFYRWRGSVERAEERQLIVKTTPERVAALEARLRKLHPYELPEFLVIRAEASEAYARWVRASVVAPRP